MSELVTGKDIHKFIAYCETMIAASNDCGDAAPSQLQFGKVLATEFVKLRENYDQACAGVRDYQDKCHVFEGNIATLKAEINDLKSKLEDDGK